MEAHSRYPTKDGCAVHSSASPLGFSKSSRCHSITSPNQLVIRSGVILPGHHVPTFAAHALHHKRQLRTVAHVIISVIGEQHCFGRHPAQDRSTNPVRKQSCNMAHVRHSNHATSVPGQRRIQTWHGAHWGSTNGHIDPESWCVQVRSWLSFQMTERVIAASKQVVCRKVKKRLPFPSTRLVLETRATPSFKFFPFSCFPCKSPFCEKRENWIYRSDLQTLDLSDLSRTKCQAG